MGNDTECKVAAIGIVQIKPYDGVVRTLSKVCHISDMTYNLISLGILEANGCMYSVENGVLKVMRSVMVPTKGLRQGNLYLLPGTTVIGSAALCTTSIDVDTTKLWHMRLGHISEKGITILSKKGYLDSAGTSKLEFCDHCVFENKRGSVSLQLNTVRRGSLITSI